MPPSDDGQRRNDAQGDLTVTLMRAMYERTCALLDGAGFPDRKAQCVQTIEDRVRDLIAERGRPEAQGEHCECCETAGEMNVACVTYEKELALLRETVAALRAAAVVRRLSRESAKTSGAAGGIGHIPVPLADRDPGVSAVTSDAPNAGQDPGTFSTVHDDAYEARFPPLVNPYAPSSGQAEPVTHHVHHVTCPVHDDMLRGLTAERDKYHAQAQDLETHLGTVHRAVDNMLKHGAIDEDCPHVCLVAALFTSDGGPK